ncbi:kinase-like domain-containing protein [Pelagophyceae sp. CCMP2097]|nr:kinase-like domain-containing protein [Pelagophyceae sp. CCMP2097]
MGTRDRNNATIIGIGDAELEGLLVDAGMPRHEVPLLIGKLNDHWASGGTIDPLLDESNELKGWGLSPAALMLLKSILGISRENRGVGRDALRQSLNVLSLRLDRDAGSDGEYEDDFEKYEDDFENADDDSVNLETATPQALRQFRRRQNDADEGKADDEMAEESVDDFMSLQSTVERPLDIDIPPPQAPPRAQTAQSPSFPPPMPGHRTPAVAHVAPTHLPPPPTAAQARREAERRSTEAAMLTSAQRPRTDRSRTARHILNGQWKLGQCIGQGSFGQVYTCMDEATGQLMAVKCMAIPTCISRAILDDDAEAEAAEAKKGGKAAPSSQSELRALCTEIELMRSFEHPNIVRYLGAAVDEPNLQLYIFQEWVPGGSLATLSSHYGALAEGVVRRYTLHILRGLEYLHSNHIIHRDIKCGNVLVDEGGVAKLADFGASFRLGANGTVTSDMKLTMRGTPYFMAPEVLQADKFGRRSDVWSLGGVVLQMATTHPPWKTLNFKTPMALFYHVVSSKDPPPLDSYNLSPRMRAFILRCFERDATTRAHAYELLLDPFVSLASPSDDDDDDLASNNGLNDTMCRIRRVTTPAAGVARAAPSISATKESRDRGTNLSSLKMRMSLRGFNG